MNDEKDLEEDVATYKKTKNKLLIKYFIESLSREKKLLLLEKLKVDSEQLEEVLAEQLEELTEELMEESIDMVSEEDLKQRLYCKYCGSKITKGQKMCPVCGKMGI